VRSTETRTSKTTLVGRNQIGQPLSTNLHKQSFHIPDPQLSWEVQRPVTPTDSARDECLKSRAKDESLHQEGALTHLQVASAERHCSCTETTTHEYEHLFGQPHLQHQVGKPIDDKPHISTTSVVRGQRNAQIAPRALPAHHSVPRTPCPSSHL
jgi:hypothetical protein